MKVLGIDSSGLVASVAVVEDDILLAEYTVNYKNTLSDLASDAERNRRYDKSGLKQPGCDRNRCRARILTGLRIGSATAKVWGWHLTNRSYRFQR